jgi:hypothetical protein
MQHVEVLHKFINFTEAVRPLVNVAAETEGENCFHFKFLATDQNDSPLLVQHKQGWMGMIAFATSISTKKKCMASRMAVKFESKLVFWTAKLLCKQRSNPYYLQYCFYSPNDFFHL